MPETLFLNNVGSAPAMLTNTSKELNRLLCAAVVSKTFRKTLLEDPISAIQAGYAGESFFFDPSQISQIMSVRAANLTDFANQLIDFQLVQHAQNRYGLSELTTQPSLKYV